MSGYDKQPLEPVGVGHVELTMPAGNPLGFTSQFPPYALITPEHVIPGMEALLEHSYKCLEPLEAWIEKELAAGTLTYDALSTELEAFEDANARSWGAVKHLQTVCDSEEMRDAIEEIEPKQVELDLRIQQSEPLYKAWEYMWSDKVRPSLTPSQERVVEIYLRDAKLSGVALEGEQKTRFNEVQTRIAKLENDFTNNESDATKAFQIRITEKGDVAGIPDSALQLAAQMAEEKGDSEANAEDGPWVFTLDEPSYDPVLSHAKSRDLRYKLCKAATVRCSAMEELTEENSTAEARESFKENARDNAAVIHELLSLREETAKLLGYANYTDLSLGSKMATLEQAQTLLENVRKAAHEIAGKELQELESFAKSEHAFPEGETLQRWDMAYYAERMKEARFAFTAEELMPYYSLAKVQQGLWTLTKKLFGVDVQKVPVEEQELLGVSPWHPDVEFFKVSDPQKVDDAGLVQTIAYFYFDPYVRPDSKDGGAWMDEVNGRTSNLKLVDRPGSKCRLPVGLIVCNQPPPVVATNTPSLMRLDDVETLFHEFGHTLQHILTEEKEGLIAGTRNIEWDAIEQPSQFMENWCYDRDVVDSMAVHYESQEKLPEDLFQKIKKARTFRAGSRQLSYLHKSLVDLKLHGDYDTSQPVEALWQEDLTVSKFTSVGSRSKEAWESRNLCTFSHAFGCTEYAAGYWTYLWAEVLSADCFASFEEAGLQNAEEMSKLGLQFRKTVLGMGSGKAPAAVFRQFRGRDPTPDALLRHQGLA